VVEVKGAEPVRIEVLETERGPVIIGGADSPGLAVGARFGHAVQAISLRYPPRVTGQIGFDTLPKLLKATTVSGVDGAFDSWVEPVNVVMAADTSGGLLHRTAGWVPRRHLDTIRCPGQPLPTSR
jgi:penicillin amidase